MIPDKYKTFFTPLNIYNTKNLHDGKTCLYIKPNVPIYRVKVDKGIVQNTDQGIKKCDYLLWDPENKAVILIELKGTDIKSALDQLKETFPNICSNNELDFMTRDIKYLFACCATSHFNLPKNADEHIRFLRKFLITRYRGTYKNKDSKELLIFVRNKNNKPDFTKNIIDNSEKYPLPIYPQIWEKYLDTNAEKNPGKKRQHT